MISPNQIKPGTPVVCTNNNQFGVVDHVEGADSIKLRKDSTGQHHYIPLSWVTRIDDKVHVDRPGDQAMREWSSSSQPSPYQNPRPTQGRAGADRSVDSSRYNPR